MGSNEVACPASTWKVRNIDRRRRRRINVFILNGELLTWFYTIVPDFIQYILDNKSHINVQVLIDQ